MDWLGMVPEHGETQRIKRFARLRYGDALPLEARTDEGGIPVYGSNGAVGQHDQPNEAETAITLLHERRSALISVAVTGKIDVRGLVAPELVEAAG